YVLVIDVPEGKPEVFIEKDMYEIGYTLRGNCTSPPSYPAINLTWFLNEKKVNESFMMRLADPDNPEDRRNPLTTVAGLELEIDGATFQSGKARIRCVADLFNIYQAQEDVVLEEERPRPRPSSVLGTRDSSGSTWLRATFLMNTAVVLSLIIR
ncbi:PREDICTED: uncharacterized protein LOC108565259, partial [Nicrophorus vespilloides]|uniref:Uncharacterized protein LOC108565259 n=1 Tax=Nicrophorus vespilloides TaxID=110193 RepID=A0ABM1MZV3_NICVS